jgi:dissimilatory sulfite reductase related protein
MNSRVIAGVTVRVDDEGFLANPAEWSREVAVEIAKEEGIPEIGDAHWQVIEFCRQAAEELYGRSPQLRQINKGTGIPTKQLLALFPQSPGKKIARIAGLKKPEGCL